MKKRGKNISGKIMLATVVGIYLIIGVLNPPATYDAMLHSLNIVKIIAPILLVVIFLTTLLNIVVNPKKISHHLGKDSGVKGFLITLFSGILSHGPAYVWFAMLKDLHSHGMKGGLVVTFFYARAIKIPWFPMMITYFGTTFALTLTFYTLIAAVIQGFIADKLLKE